MFPSPELLNAMATPRHRYVGACLPPQVTATPTSSIPTAHRIACQQVRQITWDTFAETLDREMLRRDQRYALSHVRQIALYVCHVALSLPLWQVAICFGRDRSTASITCQRVEDRRDNAAFDDFVTAVEGATTPILAQLRAGEHG